MTRLLDVLEEYLDWRGFEYLRLDGTTTAAERGALVAKFNDPGDQQLAMAVLYYSNQVYGSSRGLCAAILVVQIWCSNDNKINQSWPYVIASKCS